MIVESTQVQLLAYYLGLLGMFGIGLEFIALKIPAFLEELRKKGLVASLLDVVITFINSWQLGFILMFIAANYICGVLGDLLFFLGLGIAIPDLPARFRRYYKYLLAVIAISGVVPTWLLEFFRAISAKGTASTTSQEASTEGEEASTVSEENTEWREPEYVRQ